MSQAEKLAKTSRENLGAALNALQTSVDVPQSLMAVADPIADAMGALHRIERSQGADMSTKDVALKNVRAALDLLQALDINHPALDIVMDKVAGCLTSVHQLSRLQPTAAPAPAPAPVPAPTPAFAQQPAPAPAYGGRGTPVMPQPAGPAAAPYPVHAPQATAVLPASPVQAPQPVAFAQPAAQQPLARNQTVRIVDRARFVGNGEQQRCASRGAEEGLSAPHRSS